MLFKKKTYSNIYLYMLVSKSSTIGWWKTVLWWHAEIYTNLYIWVIMGVSKKWVPQTVGFPMYKTKKKLLDDFGVPPLSETFINY